MIDSDRFRHILAHYPTGVCAITAINSEGNPVGMVVGTFSSVSLEPPLVAFFPDRRSKTWPQLEATGKFCVNVLSADQSDVCQRFASSAVNKFGLTAHALSAMGSPILENVVAWIDCALYAVHEAGDHFIAIGQVIELDVVRPERPMIFFQGSYGEFQTGAVNSLQSSAPT